MTTTHATTQSSGMRLYNDRSERLYHNTEERTQFINAAHEQPLNIRSFCLVLAHTGCRISEGREISAFSLQEAASIVAIRSLKKRDQHHVREIPIPPEIMSILLLQLEAVRGQFPDQKEPVYLWAQENGEQIKRSTATYWVKKVLKAADITGAQACAKAIRHGFAVNARLAGTDLDVIRIWLGHTDIETTTIYTRICGPEQRAMAERIWAKDVTLVRWNHSAPKLDDFEAHLYTNMTRAELMAELICERYGLALRARRKLVEICKTGDEQQIDQFVGRKINLKLR